MWLVAPTVTGGAPERTECSARAGTCCDCVRESWSVSSARTFGVGERARNHHAHAEYQSCSEFHLTSSLLHGKGRGWGQILYGRAGVQAYRPLPPEKSMRRFSFCSVQQMFFRPRLTSSSTSRIMASVQDFLAIAVFAFGICVLILLQDPTDP